MLRTFLPALLALAAFGQAKPDFTGTWELSTTAQDGRIFQAGKDFKETQVWTQRGSQLTVKIMTWDATAGYRTLDLAYTIDGKSGPIGYRVSGDGNKAPVNGSAHWDGDRLVLEQVHSNATAGVPRRIVRTCSLESGGQKMTVDQVYWHEGSSEPVHAKWTWEKKTGTP